MLVFLNVYINKTKKLKWNKIYKLTQKLSNNDYDNMNKRLIQSFNSRTYQKDLKKD